MIIVAVVVCFVLLLFTPMKNKIGDNINDFVGNFANQTNKSLNEVRMPDELGAGDILEIEELFICDKEYKNCERIYLLLSSVDSEKYIFFKENHLLNILEEIKRWYIQIKEGYKRIIQ